MSDKSILIKVFKANGIKFKDSKKLPFKEFTNGPVNPDGFIYDSFLDLGEGVGNEGNRTLLYFLHGKLVGHGAWSGLRSFK